MASDRAKGAGASRRATVGGLAAVMSGLSGRLARTQQAPKARPRPRDDRYEVLEVGPGKRFPYLTAAGCFMNSMARWNNGYAGPERIAKMGFRIIVSPGPPGYYVNDSGSHSRRWPSLVGWPPWDGTLLGPVVVEGEAGKPPPVLCTDGAGDGVLYYQTGLFATGDCDATFRRLVFKGFRRYDGNGNYAGIRLGQTFFKRPLQNTILVEDCEFTGCDNGIMGGSPGQKVTLRRGHFHHNGNDTGRVHNIYIGPVEELTVEGVLSTHCDIGHLLKTRAARTTIRDSRLIGAGGSESACLDAPNAGVLEIDGLVCEKSPDSDANWMIHYAGENQDAAGMPFHNPSSISVRNLTLVAPPGLRRHPMWGQITGFANASGAGEAACGRGSHFVAPAASNVQVYGLTERTCGLPCRVLASRPALDLRPPVQTA
jgi:hypothetical protein